MTASDRWSIINELEENNNSFVPPSNSGKPSVYDYFEKVGDFERKCRLCSSTVKITAKSGWGMKQHFKLKHHTKWSTIFEQFEKPPKAKVRSYTVT